MPTVRSSIALLAVTAATLGGGGWIASHGSSAVSERLTRLAHDRDAAESAALEGVLVFNTVDSTHAADTVDRWLSVSAGALHRKVEAGRSAIVSRTRRLQTDSSAKVLRSGVSAFDHEAGTATVLVVLAVRTAHPKGRPATDTQRVQALVQRQIGTWRLTFLDGLGVDR